LGYANLLNLSRLSATLEVVMKPYIEMKREIITKFSTKDEKTGQFLVAPEKQNEAMKELENIAQAQVELNVQLPLVLNVKDDSFLDFNTVSSFTNVLGEDNFKIVKLETPMPNMK